jgi:hypothetical protein
VWKVSIEKDFGDTGHEHVNWITLTQESQVMGFHEIRVKLSILMNQRIA